MTTKCYCCQKEKALLVCIECYQELHLEYKDERSRR